MKEMLVSFVFFLLNNTENIDIMKLKTKDNGVKEVQEEKYYSVREVSDILKIEPYLLRYYEKELGLTIKRNNKSHRVYTGEDIELIRRIIDLREKGLQLKAIEAIIKENKKATQDTYEELSSTSLALEQESSDIMDIEQYIGEELSVKKNSLETTNRSLVSDDINITDVEDEKVKQFSFLMKEMFKQAITECGEESRLEIHKTIKEEVDLAIEEKVNQIQELHDSKNEAYYRKLDETMREIQRMHREINEAKLELSQSKKERSSFFSRLFKGKNDSISY